MGVSACRTLVGTSIKVEVASKDTAFEGTSEIEVISKEEVGVVSALTLPVRASNIPELLAVLPTSVLDGNTITVTLLVGVTSTVSLTDGVISMLMLLFTVNSMLTSLDRASAVMLLDEAIVLILILVVSSTVTLVD